MNEVIRIRDLVVTIGGKRLLSVDKFSLGRGEVLGVLGPNGAGKSTLLKTLIGLQRHFVGEVSVLGRAVASLGSGELCRLRRRIGYVPQLLVAHSEMPLTLREVVAIGRTGIVGLGRRLGRDDWKIIDEWIDRMGLAAQAGRRYADCSGGEQRKALIAKAMVQQPELLLLDEPTANLDLAWREQVVSTIQQIYQQTRVTVVLVCHELEVLPACCQKLMVLQAGCVSAVGSPGEVLTDERVAKLYGVQLSVISVGGRHMALPVSPEALR